MFIGPSYADAVATDISYAVRWHSMSRDVISSRRSVSDVRGVKINPPESFTAWNNRLKITLPQNDENVWDWATDPETDKFSRANGTGNSLLIRQSRLIHTHNFFLRLHHLFLACYALHGSAEFHCMKCILQCMILLGEQLWSARLVRSDCDDIEESKARSIYPLTGSWSMKQNLRGSPLKRVEDQILTWICSCCIPDWVCEQPVPMALTVSLSISSLHALVALCKWRWH